MRLRTLHVLGITGAALPPLLLLGVAATGAATEALMGRVVRSQIESAGNFATFVDTWMTGQLLGLGLLRSTFRLADLDGAERVGFARVVYNQFDDVNIVSLLSPDGEDLVPSQMARFEEGDPLKVPHEYVTQARFRAFRERLPIEAARQGGTALGAPYTPPDADFPVMAMVFADPDATTPVLAVEFSLARVLLQLQAQVTEASEVALLDAGGAFFARSGLDLVRPDMFTFLLEQASANLTYTLEDGQEVLGACARVTSTGWLAVVAEPYDHAVRERRQIRAQAAWFALMAVCLSAIVGLYASRRIHEPVVDLASAARDVGEGKLDRRVVPGRIQELAELGTAFNTMSGRLEADREEIRRQRKEIEAFNVELQQRVEDRTRELRDAQARLLESGKLAAVAELGAGVAHELNNPLAGILGTAQLLRQRSGGGPDDALLAAMESEAARCADIVHTLLAFTREATEGGARAVIDLDALVAEVESLVTPSFRQRGVGLRHERSPRALPVHADRARLGRALAGLLTSLRALLSPGGTLSVRGEAIEGRIRLRFDLAAGEGVADAARDDWLASGMSLWLARRVLAEQGAVLAEPDPDGPRCYLLDLPEA